MIEAQMVDAELTSARRPLRWLAEAGAIGMVGGIVCWFLNAVLLGFLTPDGYGLFFVFAAMLVLVCAAMLVVGAVLLRASARARLGASPRAASLRAGTVCAVGWLPWFAPDEARFGLTFRLAIGPATLAAGVWFVAFATLAIASRSTSRYAIVTLLAVAGLWLPCRDAVVSSATAEALSARTIPPSMALAVSWPGYVPGTYARSGDSVHLQYDLAVDFPCPDCGGSGVLTIAPATTSPCTVPMALADGRSTVPTSGACRHISRDIWTRETHDSGCDLLQIRGDRLIGIYEDDCPGTPALLHILSSLRPADSAEILHWT